MPDSPVSSDFPTFANPPEGGTISIDPDGLSITENTSHPMESWRGVLDATHSLPDTPVKDSSYRWPEDDKSDFDYRKSIERDDDEDYNSGVVTPKQITGLTGSESYTRPNLVSNFMLMTSTTVLARKTQRSPPNLAPAIWRIILFQL